MTFFYKQIGCQLSINIPLIFEYIFLELYQYSSL